MFPAMANKVLMFFRSAGQELSSFALSGKLLRCELLAAACITVLFLVDHEDAVRALLTLSFSWTSRTFLAPARAAHVHPWLGTQPHPSTGLRLLESLPGREK